MKNRTCAGVAAWVAILAIGIGPLQAQTRIKPGFNLFSVDQDIEVGRQSAAQVEKQMQVVNDGTVQKYITDVGKRLAAQAPGAKYPYQFKVVNVSDINAFALPGGFMYINRGLLEAVKSEGQLAGVMAHEMSHVALRHGTNQASKAYLGQAGLGVLGGLLGGKSDTTQRTIGAVGGFGLNVLFLKFSRTDEEQADVLGSQIMARAGYDPQDMIDFFELLRRESGKDPGRVAQFFSDHPNPANRADRIRQERKELKIRKTDEVGGLSEVQARLRRLPKAPTTSQVAQASKPKSQLGQDTVGSNGGDQRLDTGVVAPSSESRAFRQKDGFFQIDYPANWRAYEPSTGYGAVFAPDGGFEETRGGDRLLTHGVIVNHYDPFGADDDDRFGDQRIGGNGFRESGGMTAPQSRTDLAAATNDLLRQIHKSNPYLSLVSGSERTDTIDGAPSLSVVLDGRSPVTGDDERVTLFTRGLPDDHVVYLLFVAPGSDAQTLRPAFERMVSSLRVSDEAAHR